MIICLTLQPVLECFLLPFNSVVGFGIVNMIQDTRLRVGIVDRAAVSRRQPASTGMVCSLAAAESTVWVWFEKDWAPRAACTFTIPFASSSLLSNKVKASPICGTTLRYFETFKLVIGR